MKFRKIDEKTICCMLSETDLTDNNISVDDFIQNREKVQSFLEEIIEAAKEEVGFEASGSMLSIQIMAAYPDGIMITFSDDPKDMAAAIKAGLAQMKGELDDEGWIEAQTPVLEEEKREVQKETGKSSVGQMMTIFSFPDMQNVLSFVKNAPVRSGLDSSLYRDEKTGMYYMILAKKRMSEERYRAVVSTALEFGEFDGLTEVQKAGIREHCTCIVEQKAVNVLKKVCGQI